MSKSYNEIMNKIEVTDEMRQRVLSNIHKSQDSSSRIISLRTWKNAVALAACFILLVAGVFSLPQLFNRDINNPQKIVSPTSLDYSSAKELSSACNFEVKEIESLPFVVIDRIYRRVGAIAEINYLGDSNSACFRISQEVGDNSGIFEDFTTVEKIQLDNMDITVKGFGDGYCLAVWQADEFSCSLSLDKDISLEQLKAILIQLL